MTSNYCWPAACLPAPTGIARCILKRWSVFQARNQRRDQHAFLPTRTRMLTASRNVLGDTPQRSSQQDLSLCRCSPVTSFRCQRSISPYSQFARAVTNHKVSDKPRPCLIAATHTLACNASDQIASQPRLRSSTTPLRSVSVSNVLQQYDIHLQWKRGIFSFFIRALALWLI